MTPAEYIYTGIRLDEYVAKGEHDKDVIAMLKEWRREHRPREMKIVDLDEYREWKRA